MDKRELTPSEKRLVFNGLQSDEFLLSMSTPSWERVSAGFGPPKSEETAASEPPQPSADSAGSADRGR